MRNQRWLILPGHPHQSFKRRSVFRFRRTSLPNSSGVPAGNPLWKSNHVLFVDDCPERDPGGTIGSWYFFMWRKIEMYPIGNWSSSVSRVWSKFPNSSGSRVFRHGIDAWRIPYIQYIGQKILHLPHSFDLEPQRNRKYFPRLQLHHITAAAQTVRAFTADHSVSSCSQVYGMSNSNLLRAAVNALSSEWYSYNTLHTLLIKMVFQSWIPSSLAEKKRY